MNDSDNPLLATDALPALDRIRPEHVGPAIDRLLADAVAAHERAAGPDVPADYDALSAVLDVAVERLSTVWDTVGHLTEVADTPDLRAAYNACLDAVTAFYARLGADGRLCAKYKAIAAAAGPDMPQARRQVLTNALRNFVLSGAELRGEAHDRFAAVQQRKAVLSQQFSEHVLDATDAFALDADESRLAGLPADVLAAARAAAAAAGVPGARLTLHAPSYIPAIKHLADRELRHALFRGHVTRASELGPEALDNGAAMRELLQLRQEEARLLGHPSYAEVSLVRKMARTPAEVTAFLRDLARRARPHALRDAAELREFAAHELALPDLQPWDLHYAAERLREARYAYSEDEVKAYFPLPTVLHGLFRIIETLFEVSIREDHAPVVHDSVRFFRVERSAAAGPELVAQFYLDLHARPGKRPGAWMDGARSRWLRPAPQPRLQTPVARMVCNFPSPQGGRPALLTHGDVITLFHEFGHGLHHMLTRVDELDVSGTHGVEWDAVELPSQLMENFCWEWEALKQLTAHVDTGAPLPRALFDRMLAARNFHSSLQMLRQVQFALIDMRLHAEPGSEARIAQVVDEVRAETAVFPAAPFDRPLHAFLHLFAGGYAAGYYSYKWAEVLSADAFAAFEDAGVLDLGTGRRYRREVLESGGSRPAIESFRAFRGRDPRIDALLRHQGIDGPQPAGVQST
jgi:oligopeptidase A